MENPNMFDRVKKLFKSEEKESTVAELNEVEAAESDPVAEQVATAEATQELGKTPEQALADLEKEMEEGSAKKKEEDTSMAA